MKTIDPSVSEALRNDVKIESDAEPWGGKEEASEDFSKKSAANRKKKKTKKKAEPAKNPKNLARKGNGRGENRAPPAVLPAALVPAVRPTVPAHPVPRILRTMTLRQARRHRREILNRKNVKRNVEVSRKLRSKP